MQDQIELADKVATALHDSEFSNSVIDAKASLKAAENDSVLSSASIQAETLKLDAVLNHDEPAMHQYTAYLVGHAHIDFQWLWEWPETVQVCHDTFNQALKFIDEFPGFKFTQSSAALYGATEKSWPSIF